jgi:hypothetical protein
MNSARREAIALLKFASGVVFLVVLSFLLADLASMNQPSTTRSWLLWASGLTLVLVAVLVARRIFQSEKK